MNTGRLYVVLLASAIELEKRDTALVSWFSTGRSGVIWRVDIYVHTYSLVMVSCLHTRTVGEGLFEVDLFKNAQHRHTAPIGHYSIQCSRHISPPHHPLQHARLLSRGLYKGARA